MTNWRNQPRRRLPNGLKHCVTCDLDLSVSAFKRWANSHPERSCLACQQIKAQAFSARLRKCAVCKKSLPITAFERSEKNGRIRASCTTCYIANGRRTINRQDKTCGWCGKTVPLTEWPRYTHGKPKATCCGHAHAPGDPFNTYEYGRAARIRAAVKIGKTIPRRIEEVRTLNEQNAEEKARRKAAYQEQLDEWERTRPERHAAQLIAERLRYQTDEAFREKEKREYRERYADNVEAE